MLMPILTVKIPAVVAQVAVVAESISPKDRTSPVPLRISGNQSEAALKILEALNRHLVGSEPLPKEALIRLLDTLAKILKFPPLPQESLRDFTKRLAVFLETLPPAARLALEKQLGQRNLAATVRILAEALKNPSIVDAPRLLDRLFTLPAVARPVSGQPDAKPAPVIPVPQGQTAASGRPLALPTAQTLLASPMILPDAGLLQAALKKAFGDDDENIAPSTTSTEDGEAEQKVAAAPRHDEQPAKAAAPRSNAPSIVNSQPQQPTKASSESIPMLRAAAAFLAADPEALSLVAAIATGEIDSQLKMELQVQLGLDLSEQAEQLDLPEQGVHAGQPSVEHSENIPQPESLSAKGGETLADSWPASGHAQPLPEPLAESTNLPSQPETVTGREATKDSITPPPQQTLARNLNEVEGFKGHDLGEWELEAEPERPSFASADEPRSTASAPAADRAEESLTQTLKALVEASLPLPEGAKGEPDSLFATLAGETADMGAEILFAQLETIDDDAILPDTSFLTGDIDAQSEPIGLETDSWSALLDGPEEKPANRQNMTHSTAADEAAREAPRLPDTGIVRDAIPFAMIPYLPAKTLETRKSEIEEEDAPSFANEESESQHGEGDDHPDNRDDKAAMPQTELQEEDDAGDTAYDLYRRMGGLS